MSICYCFLYKISCAFTSIPIKKVEKISLELGLKSSAKQ